MKTYISRFLEETLSKHLTAFPVVGITGPRQSGKSAMLKHLFDKKYTYVTFDDYKQVKRYHPFEGWYLLGLALTK